MEKIVVLTGSHGDENLVSCLRMLFPECMIEVHERRPRKSVKSSLAPYNPSNNILDQKLDQYLSFS